MKHIKILILLSLLSTSCLPSKTSSMRTKRNQDYSYNQVSAPSENIQQGVSGETSVKTNDSLSSDSETQFQYGKVEIRHLVDPFDGTYKTKLTIPKNFNGFLYLSGLNIASLTDRIVSVRFNFGRELGTVTVEGVIGRAPGLTPSTDIEVIQLDLKHRPFENIRLLYDLYDYNNYRSETGDESLAPVTDPLDDGLYCRGLKLEHDPTFELLTNDVTCDGLDALGVPNSEKCLYSYVKILDSGLWSTDPVSLPQIPSALQLNLEKGPYTSESQAVALKKCLPDNNDRSNLNSVLNLNLTSLGYGTTGISLDGNTFTYNGPYRSIAPSYWEILQDSSNMILDPVGYLNNGSSCVTDYQCANNCCLKSNKTCGSRSAEFDENCLGGGPRGIFQKSYNGSYLGGYQSFLFPRAGTLDLSTNVEYFGSEAPFDTRTLKTMLTNGESTYVDGCNLRVLNYNSYANEGIGSCNVSAYIEIITKNKVTGDEEILADSIAVKLQLVRASLEDYQGREVLYTSMKTCTNTQSCGGGECCFNNRCWSKELVSQCLEETPEIGNLGVGETCQSDFQCSSLCCNETSGSCAPHVNTSIEQTFCSKFPDQKCVAKEFCRQENVTECLIVKTGLSSTGAQECALRCYNTQVFGDCVNGRCVPPKIPAIPTFDPLNPDCSSAVDPPQ